MAADPYILLGIDENVNDSDVAGAYHRALRRFPPEESPDIFAAISEAYESIKTEQQRVHRRLFPETISCEKISTYFIEPNDSKKYLTPIKRKAWLHDASQAWLESKLNDI